MKNTYTMLMKITRLKTGEIFNLSYKLDDSNRSVASIVTGWESANYIVNSLNVESV